MVREKISNKNLFVAEELLKICEQKPYLVRGNEITITEEDIFEIPKEEIIESLKRLENRGLVSFTDETDKYDDNYRKYIVLDFQKDKLAEFIEIAKDRFYKITKTYKKKEELNQVIEALASILSLGLSEIPVEITKVKEEHKDIFWWIADYSGMLKIIYENIPDPKNPATAHTQYVIEAPTKFVITDIKEIKRLEKEIRQLVIMSQTDKIKLFLEKSKGLDWKCPKCKRWLEIKLEDEKQIAGFLNDFYIHKFKVCYDCRKRNYFTINPKGEIKFSTTRRKTLTEIKNGEEEQKNKDFNKAVKMSNKLRKQLEDNKKREQKLDKAG